MSPTIRADPAAHTLSVDAGKLCIRSVITTIDPDRAGDIVVPTGLRNHDDFMMNPVVLWAHNRMQFPPIGVCEWIDVQPRRVVAQTRFAQGVRFSEDIFRLYEQGVLRGWSIGFVPRKTHKIPRPRGSALIPRPAGEGTRGSGGQIIEEWDLLEYSAVPIPENPGALTVALQKGLVRDPTLRDWLNWLPNLRTDDVLGELVEAETK